MIVDYPWKDSILDTIRDRPAMYIGQNSLTGLWFFLNGFEMAISRLGQYKTRELPPHFADWVGYRLHMGSSYNGFWHRAILDRVKDESLAVDRFYELRDECFKKPEPITVATIRKDRREYKTGCYDATQLYPESLKIVVYTDDPGFFLSGGPEDDPLTSGHFFAAFSLLGQPTPDRFEIHDDVTWKRLLAEDAKYRKNLSAQRRRILKKDR